jgi:hypothetical protein
MTRLLFDSALLKKTRWPFQLNERNTMKKLFSLPSLPMWLMLFGLLSCMGPDLDADSMDSLSQGSATSGLKGQYFNSINLTGAALERVDASIDFDWGKGSPIPKIGSDNFSVRWTGFVEPKSSETYTFYTIGDDGIRLYVDGKLVVNDWSNHGPRERSGTISLKAGQNYPIQLEYYESSGGAVAKLLWSSPKQAKQIIPAAQLKTEISTAVDNIALGKPTTQSSIAYNGHPSRAVDGNTSGQYGDKTVSHTDFQSAPWWRVDLGGAFSVKSVTLFNRTDCCGDRLSDFRVDYLDQNGKTIATQAHPGRAAVETNIALSAQGVHAVRVQLNGTNALSLAEVQVFGSSSGGGIQDQCPNDPNKTAPGICGCGVSDKDSDKDGTPDCKDNCPDDPRKTQPGECGCGVAEGTCGSGGKEVLSTKIVHPWRSTTAIVKAGESFDVWFVADSSSHSINSVLLRGPYHTVTTTRTVMNGNWVYDPTSGNKYNRRITVTVPESAPADRYDLLLRTSTGTEIAPRAVKVIKDYKDNYYIMHMSDLHRWQGGHDTTTILKKASAIIDIANIIDAEMLFETGDSFYCHTDNASITAERASMMFNGQPELGIKGLYGANAATFTVPGNHDSPKNDYTKDASRAETAAFYNKYYGLQSYNFAYGNGRFLGVNSGMGPVPSDQTSAAVSWLNEVGKGNFRLGAGHAGESAIRTFDSKTVLSLILVGHNHFIASSNPHEVNGRYTQFVANSLREMGTGNFEYNLFKVNNKTGSYEVMGGASSRVRVIQNHTATNIPNPGSWILNLALTYAKTNNGSSRTNKATIVNRYNFPITGAKVRFVMPMGFSYSVSKGVVQQSFNGDKYHIVDVTVDLPANSTTVVDIS